MKLLLDFKIYSSICNIPAMTRIEGKKGKVWEKKQQVGKKTHSEDKCTDVIHKH